MPVSLRESRAFGRSSPVTRYWLAHCVGFGVTGGSRGHVEAVVSNGHPHEAEILVVRSRHRVHRVPASAVRSVVPGQRLVVVERAPSRIARGGRGAARLTGRVSLVGGRLAGRALLVACVLAWRLAQGSWRVGSPLAAAALRRAWAAALVWTPRLVEAAVAASRIAWSEGARLIRSVPWQRFGPSVRSATTRTWQARSRISSRLRTTSSPPTSESDSVPEAGTTSST